MENFLIEIDKQIQNKHLLKHEFYKAWTRGELSKECLKEYAKEYYHHVKAFPRYLSALHSHTDDDNTRKHLLKNLMEEEAGKPNHPDLWRLFAKKLGATDAEIDAHLPSKVMLEMVNTFFNIARNGRTAEGIAALYAYESQIPAVCVSKIDGLKQHYGMPHSDDWKYFSVHIEADKEHAATERSLLIQHVNNDNQASIRQAVDEVLTVLWNFLSCLCDRYNLCSSMS